MGDHNNSAAFCQCSKGFLNQHLILRIGKSGCLVKNHNGGILQNGSGQCDALLFTTRKIGSFGADLCIKTIWQFIKNILALGSH